MKKYSIIGLVIAVAAVVIITGFFLPNPPPTADEAAIRTTVESFVGTLKNVSLLAPDAGQQMAVEYAPYITPELLLQWQAAPKDAPGRLTSSPWPERIEVTSISHEGTRATIQGTLVEVTSANQGTPAAQYLVLVGLEKRGAAWRIASWSPGPAI